MAEMLLPVRLSAPVRVKCTAAAAVQFYFAVIWGSVKFSVKLAYIVVTLISKYNIILTVSVLALLETLSATYYAKRNFIPKSKQPELLNRKTTPPSFPSLRSRSLLFQLGARGPAPPRNRCWCVLALTLTSDCNNFNDFPNS